MKVRLAPLGHIVLLSAENIEKIIIKYIEYSKPLVIPQGKIEDLDIGWYIKEWAVKYGFTAQQVKDEVDKWIKEVEENRNDLHKEAVAALEKKEFNKARKLFLESAEYKLKILEETKHKEKRLIEEIVRDLRLEGDSDRHDYRPAEALESYRRALQLVSKEDMPQLWAATWRDIGKANMGLSFTVKGPAMQKSLDEAVEAYRRALEVYTRQDLPQEWAKTQLNLTLALVGLGNNRAGEESAQLWAEAQSTLTQALEIIAREELPQLWAVAQNHQGTLLLFRAGRMSGQEQAALVGESELAFQRALEVFTRAEFPTVWASAQYQLGFALRLKLFSTSAEEHQHLLRRIVAAHQQALEVLTLENDAGMWRKLQVGLGSALRNLGLRATGGLWRSIPPMTDRKNGR